MNIQPSKPLNKESLPFKIPYSIKLGLGCLAFFSASQGFSQTVLNSKISDLELRKEPASTKVVCTVGRTETLELLKKGDLWSFVKANCGNGWAQNENIVFEVSASDKQIEGGPVEIIPWHEMLEMIHEFSNMQTASQDEAEIDRDFSEYLAVTLDRENTERANGEF